MAETVNEDSGVGKSVEESTNGQHSQSAEEAISEWRSSGTPSTSPPYWDIDEDDDYGLKPSELYGRHEWKISKFSEINKRELRSNCFEAGGYKWYILIYPHGCDVANHLSLFLCVANHDKLLPGWSHFAQFTIAVVHKDTKKSKYSDTLHRFWKKEHDWGWKKFMELNKLKDGFIDDSDTLTIIAKIQVIRERVDRPFRCLDCEYRRELVRVYSANVEQICRCFVEERRNKLGRLIEDKARWTSFGVFWSGMDQNSRRQMSVEKIDVILKGVVKHFFIEKEVTSTLVMDSLYSGLKALEGQSNNKNKKKAIKPRLLDAKELPAPIVSVEKDMFVLVDDVLLLLQRASLEPLPPKDDKAQQNRTKDANDGEDNKEADELKVRRLTELGRRTVEIFVLAHIFSKIEVAYQEAIALKRQEELIREEEEAWLAETEQRAKRGAAEREKKSKKKQAKQKRNKNKGKDKRKEEKLRFVTHEKDQHDEEEEEKVPVTPEKPDTIGDLSDISDSVDGSAEILIQPDLEDRDSSSVHWDNDAPPPSSGRGISIATTPNGLIAERRNHQSATMDDSSSTCSNDSIRSGVTNGSYKGNNSLNFRKQKGKNQEAKTISDTRSLDQVSRVATESKSQNRSFEVMISAGESDWVLVSHETESSRNRGPIVKVGSLNNTAAQTSVDMDRPKEKSAAVLSSPRSTAKNPEKKSVSSKKVMSPPWSSSPPSSDMQKISVSCAPKQQPTMTISRPSSAPIIPAMQQPVTILSSSSAQPTSLPRSVSSAGRLGPESSSSSSLHNQNQQTFFIPQSYKHAIVGGGSSPSPSFSNHHQTTSYSQTPTSSYQSSSFPYSQDGLLWTSNPGMNNSNNPYTQTRSQQAAPQSLMTDEFPHLDIINDLLEDEHCSNMVFNGYNSPQVFHNSQQYGFGACDLSGGELLSNGGGRSSRSYGEEGLFHYMPQRVSSPYVGADGLIQTQWQMANMDLSLLAMRNNNNLDDVAATANGYHHYNNTYFGFDSSSFSSGINGYTEFRPSNGH